MFPVPCSLFPDSGRGPQGRVQNRAHRALSVRAGDVDRAEGLLRIAQRRAERTDRVQSGLHSEATAGGKLFKEVHNIFGGNLRLIIVGGAPVNPDILKFFQDIGLICVQGYGLTECSPILALNRDVIFKNHSAGIPARGVDVKILNPDDDGIGEFIAKGPNIFLGYYKDPENTAAALDADGYYHTGDIAWKDEDGYFWYVSRIDDVIKSSGYRIGPFEIENVIMELPYVLECGVSAAPDEVRGQVVKASIVLVPGTEPTDELKKEIQNYVKQKTAPYKYPRIVEFKDELPKTISGKIIRKEL